MNPFYKEFGPSGNVPLQNNQPMPGVPLNSGFSSYLQNATQMAQQMMQRFNPQQITLNAFRNFNIPAEIQNDPDQIANYLLQNENMLNPIQRQVLHMQLRR